MFLIYLNHNEIFEEEKENVEHKNALTRNRNSQFGFNLRISITLV